MNNMKEDKFSKVDFSLSKKVNKEKTPEEKPPHKLTGRPRPPEVREKISQSLKGKPKNYLSWLKGKTGPNHPSYKHGLGKRRVPVEEEPIYAAWVQGIYQRWNFCCALTGVSNVPLEVHHLNSWDSYPEQRYDLSNGVLLSKNVHKTFHKIYGNGKNTRAQFEQFVQTHYKDQECAWNNIAKNYSTQENHQPILQLEHIVEQLKTVKQKAFDNFLNLVKERNHEFISGTYEQVHSEICIYCKKHDFYHHTTFHNYKRSKTGLPCCGRELQFRDSNIFT